MALLCHRCRIAHPVDQSCEEAERRSSAIADEINHYIMHHPSCSRAEAYRAVLRERNKRETERRRRIRELTIG